MQEPITYNLTSPAKGHDFYTDLETFTYELLEIANDQLGPYADDYYSHIIETKIEKPRARDEYLLELVITGVLVKNYYSMSQETSSLSTKTLEYLYQLRREHQGLKPTIDRLRGVLSYILLERRGWETTRFSLKGFDQLLKWLGATGEFNEEVMRLNQWKCFFNTKDEAYFTTMIHSAFLFAGYLELKGEEILGRYVCNVNHFLENKLATHRYKEDYFFVGRKRNEYFMNMFGAEIMNQSMREEFKSMPNKAVLLPTCMRTPPPTGCLARNDGKELVCMQCNQHCNVGKVATKMKKHKVKCYLIPHSSGFSRFLRKWENNTVTGLVGVTCILNLLTGGYEMKRLNISSQCIFLDYCGCKKHWDKEGIATALNLEQLVEIVS